MPLSSGAADKFGNRYEGKWTVFCMSEVLEERADSIRLEPPGEEGEGIEFWVNKDGERQYHQVKRQHGAEGRWTLNELGRRGVLSNFWNRLARLAATCQFVSADGARELDELADRAWRSSSLEEFDREFLGKDQRRRFDRLCTLWGGPERSVAFERLRRVRVRTVDEDTLATFVDARLAPLVEGESATARDTLAQFALERVHHELTAHDMWHWLEKRGIRRRVWANDPHVLARVEETNDGYLAPLRERAVGGTIIPRQEKDVALDLLESEDGRRGVLLAGRAGVGKSGVVLQALEELKERGVPFLAFRVDRLDPTPSPRKIGEQLALPDSPVAVLAAVAQGRPCVLVLDQLDAVSLASGRHPDFFDGVHALVRQAQAHPRMRVLLACRKFDLDNDNRLRGLAGDRGVAHAVDIGRLPEAEVREAVAAMGIESGRLDARRLDLLSVPLHLSLLEETIGTPAAKELDFRTAKDLYDLYWERKRDLLRGRTGRLVRFPKVVDALCDYLSAERALSAPATVLDDHDEDLRDDARAMASEHVLVRDGSKYAFFHEGFFDYAFARRFADRDRQLLPFLRDDQQHLFRRAQVRQVLLHERDADRTRYLEDLSALLTAPDVRFHIKQVVFALLSALEDPSEEEWAVLAPLLDAGEEPYAREIFGVLSRAAWFKVVDSLGLWERWLAQGDAGRLSRAVWVLRMVQAEEPDRVAELVEPYVEVPDWRNRVAFLARTADLRVSHRFFKFFLKAIDEGTLDDADSTQPIYRLAGENPERACKALYHHLRRQLEVLVSADQPQPCGESYAKIFDGDREERLFTKVAQRAPKAFVAELLPFMVELAETLAEHEGDPPYPDPVWGHRYPGGPSAEDAALAAMEAALGALAQNEPQAFDRFSRLLRASESETAQYLLVRAYASSGEQHADEAVEYLLEEPRRLETGYANESHWATRELLAAATLHCSPENLGKLEDLVLGYYSEWELGAESWDWRGHAQLTLLGGIEPSRLSSAAAGRLKEWRQKFGGDAKKPSPRFLIASDVGPPISEEEAKAMTDEEWLAAVLRYPDGRRKVDRPFDRDAHDLSGVLERRVKEEPARFAELVLRFSDDAHPYYFDAVLRGLAEVGTDPGTLLRVCRRCHQLPERPCGRWMCDAVVKATDRALPEELLKIVAWYATEDPDPGREVWRDESPGEQAYYGGSPLGAGINSTRGKAATTIASLIWADAELVSFFLAAMDRTVRDPSIAVRSCAAMTLASVLNHDRDLAVGMFVRLCDAEEALLGTHPVEEFLHRATSTHFEQLKSLLERMVASDDPEVVMAGARQVCVASLDIEGAASLAGACLSGGEAQRVGAAQIFAANLKTARFRTVCDTALRGSFNDTNEKVRAEASRCFFFLEGDQLGEHVDLAEAFVVSPAFTDKHNDLMYSLERTTARVPALTCLVCERLLDAAKGDQTDVSTFGTISDNAVQLLLRAYGQSRDPDLAARCLDLFDRMAQLGVYGLDEALVQYER